MTLAEDQDLVEVLILKASFLPYKDVLKHLVLLAGNVFISEEN